MKLWVFACKHHGNVKIGHDTKMWAVSILDDRTNNNRWSKAQNMPPNSRGIIYSSDLKAFTMPFVTIDYAEERVVKGVWPEPWHIPFPIHPLGPPSKLVNLNAAKKEWPMLQGAANPTHCMNGLNGRTVFVPNEIEIEDWNLILDQLADEKDSFPEPEKVMPLFIRDILR